MRAITVQPGKPGTLQLEEFKAPSPERGDVLVRAIALGVCGTDRDIIRGEYGEAPPGHERLIIGHESLGRVEQAPAGSGLKQGDLVVGIVRHPDPVPCASCAAGEWDMCRNDRFTEHGIKALDGFGSELYRIDRRFVIKVDESLGLLGVLVEPASVVAKAWEHVERIGARARWTPRKALVTGAGPIGLLAAALGLQRGIEMHVLDRATHGLTPTLATRLGATYHHGSLEDLPDDFDVVLECTGAAMLAIDVVRRVAADGIVCLLGVTAPGTKETIDVGAFNSRMVLGNRVVFGSVNANVRHYEAAVTALARADRAWLASLITRRVPLESWGDAFEKRDGDVKTIVEFDVSTVG
jgi:threonine dehydrogenase-like Zn-dependent dehydrogenase